MEEILDKKIVDGNILYFVRWNEDAEESLSWEPVNNLECKNLIEEYENSHAIEDDKEEEEENFSHDSIYDKDIWTLLMETENTTNDIDPNYQYPSYAYDLESEEEDEEENLDIEILDKRVQWGKLLYLVRQIGDKGEEEIFWEAADNLDCEDKIKEYEGKSKATRSKYLPLYLNKHDNEEDDETPNEYKNSNSQKKISDVNLLTLDENIQNEDVSNITEMKESDVELLVLDEDTQNDEINKMVLKNNSDIEIFTFKDYSQKDVSKSTEMEESDVKLLVSDEDTKNDGINECISKNSSDVELFTLDDNLKKRRHF